MKPLLTAIKAPALDVWDGMDRCLERGNSGLVLMLAGLVIGWWVYVPVHELMHCLGCIVTGGEVRELQVDAAYGGALLAHLFDFVVVGSEYAGQLTDFDREPDLRWLSTVVMPFALTVFPGVWLLLRFGRAGRPLLFGAMLPVALAPFVSLTGDAYETGSIVATWLPPWASPEMRELLRGDDLVLHARRVSAAPSAPWVGFVLASALGCAWAFGTHALARWVGVRISFLSSPSEPRKSTMVDSLDG